MCRRGIIKSSATNEFIELVEKLKIYVITTMMGIGAIPGNHPLCLGMLGSHGTGANLAAEKSDLLIIGARVADRATVNPDTFARSAKLFTLTLTLRKLAKI